MEFILLHNADSKKILGAVVQDKKHIGYVVKGDALAPVEVLLTRGRIDVEDKTDDRTIIRKTINRTDEDYLNQIRYKFNPPVISSVFGSIYVSTIKEALMRLWFEFAEGELPPIKMIAA